MYIYMGSCIQNKKIPHAGHFWIGLPYMQLCACTCRPMLTNTHMCTHTHIHTCIHTPTHTYTGLRMPLLTFSRMRAKQHCFRTVDIIINSRLDKSEGTCAVLPSSFKRALWPLEVVVGLGAVDYNTCTYMYDTRKCLIINSTLHYRSKYRKWRPIATSTSRHNRIISQMKH